MLELAQKYDSKVKLRLIPDIIAGWKTIVILFSVLVFFGLSIWWFNKTPALQGLWNNFVIDKKVPASFCEQVHINSPVRQPVNTFSNIIYLLTAIIILNATLKSQHSDTKEHLVKNNYFLILFAFVLLYVFAASTFYHASLIGIAHTFDYSAVYSFSLFPTIFFINQWGLLKKSMPVNSEKRKPEILFLVVFIAVSLGLTLLTPKNKEPVVGMILVFLFLASGIITLLIRKQKAEAKYLFYSIFSVVVAVLWFEFDKNKIACDPKSFFQPHSLWNVFIGVSAFWFYLYMRMEKGRESLIVKLKQ